MTSWSASGSRPSTGAAAAHGADPRGGEEGPDRLAGQGNPRVGAAAGPGRQDPPPARQLAAWQLAELVAVKKKISALTAELKQRVKSSGSKLMDLPGVGPIVAARTLADVGDVARLTDRNRFSSWTSTAPLDASSGQQIRHRLPGSGNRRVNHMIHIAAATRSATTPLPVMDLARQLVRPGVEFDRRRLCGACCWDLAGRRAVLSGPLDGL